MAIKVGDRVPNGSFTVMSGDGPKPMTTDELFKGKKVVLFAVPGAFTPTCHKNHLPGFVKNAAAIKGKGVDTIAVTGVNDVFVMDAWKKASGGERDLLREVGGSAENGSRRCTRGCRSALAGAPKSRPRPSAQVWRIPASVDDARSSSICRSKVLNSFRRRRLCSSARTM